MTHQYQHDVLIIGSGASGLSLALQLAEHAKIAVLSKDESSEGATFYAQGGVSAVLDTCDSIESHVQDTLRTGDGLCDEAMVRFVVGEGKNSIQWLIDLGINFTRADNTENGDQFHLNREGGHSHRRIIHAADETGRAIETTLGKRARAHHNIELFEYHTAIDLIVDRAASGRCLGTYAYDTSKDAVEIFSAKSVVLATGGVGKVYMYTSNPDICTGDGIAMAWRAGCRIANMEFIQFHPTCLYHPDAKSFLISEALRGEGAKLLLADGTPFMSRFDERGELAPRDIVARAIDHEMKRSGSDCVYLDISHKPKAFIVDHFPTIYQRCLCFGYDLAKQPVPVVPAAHYTCGGIIVDRYGHTDIPALYAIGEVAHSGLHGANRMASNSLLECVVSAHAAYQDIQTTLTDLAMPQQLRAWDDSQVTDSNEEVVLSHNWDELRRFMWDYVGIVRTTKRLYRALSRINLLKTEIMEYYGNFRITNDLIELRNLVTVADLIVNSALARKESRGLHYSLDYPISDSQKTPQNTVLHRENLS